MRNKKSPISNLDQISRRQFLKQTALAAAALGAAPAIIPASARGADGYVAPSNRIVIGMIGVGDHGTKRNLVGHLSQEDAQIVAVCDVDRKRRESAKQMVEAQYAATYAKTAGYKGCAAYNDFRELLARPDIDGVQVSTPDHWHVPIALAAVRAGKDVICEKPLTLTVSEGRILADAVARYGRVFQTSSENRSIGVYHQMAEIVRNGRLGKLKRITVGLPKGWPGAPEGAARLPSPVPEGLDYNLWLGPAPVAPYALGRVHYHFRWVLDYSGGELTDWGAHLIDIAQWGNDTEHTGPVTVEGKGVWPDDPLYNTATEFDVLYTYANGVELNVKSTGPSIRFEGTDGWIGNTSWRGELQAEPAGLLREPIGLNELHLYTCPGQEHRNFLDCVKNRRDCYGACEIGHRTITIAHLGNIAMKLGRKLRWDPARERFVDAPDADRYLTRFMREPWSLLV